jgi:tetratricopeptide (TPR) repeat protein
LKNFEDALKIFKKTLKINSQHFPALYNKGYCLLILGKTQKALECFEQVLRISPQDEEALTQYAYALFEMKRYEEAASIYDQLLTIYPNETATLYNRACIASIQNDPKLAINLLKKTVELDRSFIEDINSDEDLNKIRDCEEFKRFIKEL